MKKKTKNFTAFEKQAENKNIDVIADTILSRAHKLADDIINDAKASAAEAIEQKRASIDAYCAKIISDAQTEAKKIMDHSEMLSEMESKKIIQNSLSHILDRTFLGVENNILKLPGESYLKLLEGMIRKYADEGDEVIVSRNEKYLTADWLDKVNVKYKFNLTLSEEKGAFSGGMLLRNKIYDKNLTISILIKQMREGIQSEVLELVMSKQE